MILFQSQQFLDVSIKRGGEREEKTFLFAKNNADFSVYCDRRLFLLSLILLCFGQLTLVSIIENLDSQTFVPPKGK